MPEVEIFLGEHIHMEYETLATGFLRARPNAPGEAQARLRQLGYVKRREDVVDGRPIEIWTLTETRSE